MTWMKGNLIWKAVSVQSVGFVLGCSIVIATFEKPQLGFGDEISKHFYLDPF